jgi:Mg-chelatase subunit ChlD
MTTSPQSPDPTIIRWRQVLGKFSQQQLPCNSLSTDDARREAVLEYLYGREYAGRGVRGDHDGTQTEKNPGTLDPSQLNVPTWLNEIRELFPKETTEILEKHALDRYQITELITDPEVLEKLEPNQDLLKMVLTFRGRMQGEVLNVARRIIRQVVEDLRRQLEQDIRRTLLGKLNRQQHSPLKIAQNFDWKGTIRANLKNYDPDRHQIILQNPRFFSRIERQIPWQIILCVDQSGSMASSVIHSAVMSGILAGLPSLKVNLVVFDTSVIDLSDHAQDPVEILMSVQLGGGTDIGKAMHYCETLVIDPHRTILVLISDFAEGASPKKLLTTTYRLQESGVKLIGLASLDEIATAYYDRQMAERLAALGMEIAALTPKQLAEWLVKIIR